MLSLNTNPIIFDATLTACRRKIVIKKALMVYKKSLVSVFVQKRVFSVETFKLVVPNYIFMVSYV